MENMHNRHASQKTSVYGVSRIGSFCDSFNRQRIFIQTVPLLLVFEWIPWPGSMYKKANNDNEQLENIKFQETMIAHTNIPNKIKWK